jgi:hypothetical protein
MKSDMKDYFTKHYTILKSIEDSAEAALDVTAAGDVIFLPALACRCRNRGKPVCEE